MDTKQLNTQMNMYIENPFASPTEVAAGDYFVGRKSVLKRMHDYVVYEDRICNYHIVGLPRIGKSSLLKKFQEHALENHYNLDLIVIYLSLDTCNSSDEMWENIGRGLRKKLKRQFGSSDKYKVFEEELEFEDVDENNIDYKYVCSVALSMKTAGFYGLVLIDEFDNFSSIAKKGTVGQIRTLLSGPDYGVRAIVASRRMVERIEKEVEGAINSNVSILAAIFANGHNLESFNEDDMNEYWAAISKKIDCNVSEKYKQEVQYYVGSHPCLLNLLNGNYWNEQESKGYISDDDICLNLSKDLINKLHDAFNWAVWRDMEKWHLLRSLILSTWGPDSEIPNAEFAELERYGVINKSEIISEPNGPIRLAISRYFTEWMQIKRYILPFGDEWSKAEGNMRKIVKCFCGDMYQGNEIKMISHLETKHIDTFEKNATNPKFTAKGRFDSMRQKKTKAINKYPDMSSWTIDYSDPSDLPEIFFKREWLWFEQVLGKTWDYWRDKFATINEIRNIKSHNNEGIPEVRVELAKKYCHEVNERIESYLAKK